MISENVQAKKPSRRISFCDNKDAWRENENAERVVYDSCRETFLERVSESYRKSGL